jgi:hypothetical protein
MLAPDRMPGTNGLAVAALVLGILGFVPPLGAAAIVLGVMALRQASRRNQGGKGLAIAGIVLGSLAVVSWVVVLVFLARAAEPKENAAGQVTQEASVLVDDLTSGDCYNGGKKAQVDLVTVVPCSSPHESQLVTSFELPPGPYASSQAIIRAAERGCADKADPLVDTTRDDLEPTFIYPDPDSLDSDRTVLCTVEAISGTVTGSALT